MIELSISAKPAAPPPPATPVSGVAPGGFARTLDALADAPPARPETVAPRHDDAARGKKLPAAATDSTDDPATATTSLPAAKPDLPPVPATPAPATVALSNLPLIAAFAHDPASSDDDAKPAKDDKKDDDASPMATPAVPPVIAAPILIPIAPPPPTAPVADNAPAVTRSAARTTADISFSPARAASVGQDAAAIAPDPRPAQPVSNDTSLAGTTTQGMIALPPQVTLLDAGTPKAVAPAPAATVITAPRIATPDQTPHFAIAPATTAPAPTPTAPVAVTAQPAREAFAAALAALAVRAPAQDDDTKDQAVPLTGFAAPIGDTLIQAAVQQVANSSQSALDPRHDQGLNGMIDHIEMLRDNANAGDTRIRLAPDALGTVDVAVRRDGAALHVRFSSPNEATRAVLGDAQPRLAALAEARGVRIAGSSIDSGTGGGNAQPQAQPQPHIVPLRPTSAPRGTAAAGDADTDTMTDQRLA